MKVYLDRLFGVASFFTDKLFFWIFNFFPVQIVIFWLSEPLNIKLKIRYIYYDMVNSYVRVVVMNDSS